MKVLSLKAEGASYKEIMAATGYSKANVAKIVKLYFEKGLEEIIVIKYGGNHRNLSYEEEEQILQLFIKEKAEEGQNRRNKRNKRKSTNKQWVILSEAGIYTISLKGMDGEK